MAVPHVLPDTEETDTEGFWAAAREGRLVVQECTSCGTLRFPPRPFCSSCDTPSLAWREVSGYGRVWTYAVSYPPALPAFEPFVPYPIAYIELEDFPGLRMAGNLVAGPNQPINSVPLEDIKIGLRVKVCFAEPVEDVVLPQWTPVGEV